MLRHVVERARLLRGDDRPRARRLWAVAVGVLVAGLVVGMPDAPDSAPVIVLLSGAAAITWDGRQTAVPAAARPPTRGIQSPDGTRFLVGNNVVDRSGSIVGAVPKGLGVPVWADDSRHLCGIRRASGGQGSTMLQLLTPGRAARDVADVGAATRIAACSVLNDRAVVSQSTPGTEQVWLVRLSDGRVLRHDTYRGPGRSTSGGEPGTVYAVASRDGSTMAVTTGPSQTSGAGRDTAIVRLQDGAVLARLTERVVLAFSWDAQLAVTTPAATDVPSVVRWRTGEVLWTANASYANPPLAEPNGGRLAVGTMTGEIWIVSPDGHAIQAAAGDYLPSGFGVMQAL